MIRPLRVAAGSDIPMLDLRDGLLLRLGALDLIRGCIVRCIENAEVGDILLSASYLLDIVIEDCRQEIANTFKEVQHT